MFDNPVYNYPMDAVLDSLGVRQSHNDMYFSPLRTETTASFHVDREKNLWYDHGMGIGGTNVQLVMMVLHCGQKEAEKYISTLSPELAHLNWVKETKPKSEIVKVGPIFSYYLMSAYNRDGIKNDKVDSMIIATISNAIDCTLRDSGYKYKYEFEGYSAYLRVSISQKRKVEFEISKAHLPKVLPVLKSTIDALSQLQSQVGDFSVIPCTDINMI